MKLLFACVVSLFEKRGERVRFGKGIQSNRFVEGVAVFIYFNRFTNRNRIEDNVPVWQVVYLSVYSHFNLFD